MTSRVILHLDLDSFYCCVEQLRNPALRGKPFAVGGRPEQRGVVASASYEARATGVRSAMPMAQALRLCPNLLVISPHFDDYRATSRKVMAYLQRVTELVEQISIDEAFLDTTAVGLPGEDIARDLQATIANELHLPCSLGIASNKLVAKMANSVGKAQARRQGTPSAITVVPPGEEAAFLAPLPVNELWGVGPKTAERLIALGFATIGDLAHADENILARMFGKHGPAMRRHARGIDDRPIVTEHESKSISREITFAPQDVRDWAILERTVQEQAQQVAATLRREGRAGRTIVLKLRWSDFSTMTRQTTLQHPTDDQHVIGTTALRTLRQIWDGRRSIRLIGVGITGLGEPLRQLSIWDISSAEMESSSEDQPSSFGHGDEYR